MRQANDFLDIIAENVSHCFIIPGTARFEGVGPTIPVAEPSVKRCTRRSEPDNNDKDHGFFLIFTS